MKRTGVAIDFTAEVTPEMKKVVLRNHEKVCRDLSILTQLLKDQGVFEEAQKWIYSTSHGLAESGIFPLRLITIISELFALYVKWSAVNSMIEAGEFDDVIEAKKKVKIKTNEPFFFDEGKKGSA